MQLHNLIFWCFAILALCGAMLVILAKNPVRAVLALIVTFLATAVTWLILQAEFLAVTLILVYVGAVMVLFLFVVMMLDISFATLRAKFTRWLPLGLGVSTLLFLAIVGVVRKTTILHPDNIQQLAFLPQEQASNTSLLGRYIFTNYLLQFELAGLLLLVAIIAAIGLIFRGPQHRKVQNISRQIKVNPAERVHLVDGK